MIIRGPDRIYKRRNFGATFVSPAMIQNSTFFNNANWCWIYRQSSFHFFEVLCLDFIHTVIMAIAIITAKTYAENTRRKFMKIFVHIPISLRPSIALSLISVLYQFSLVSFSCSRKLDADMVSDPERRECFYPILWQANHNMKPVSYLRCNFLRVMPIII